MSEEALRLDAVAARVAAWHNRHPLARRIQASQVGHVGVVTLPFLAPGAGALPGAASAPVSTPLDEQPAGRWARLLRLRLRLKFPARLRRRGSTRLQPAFDEDFLPPWRPAALARWAARHGDPGAAPAPDILLRVVPASTDPALPTRTVGVASAAIDLGALKSRVLIGRGPRAAILGRRLWSPLRLMVAAVAFTTLTGSALTLWHGRPAPTDSMQAAGGAAPAMQAAAPLAPSPAVAAESAVAASASPLSAAPQAEALAQPHLHPQPEVADAEPRGASVIAAVAASAPAAVPSFPPSPPAPAARQGTRTQAANIRSLGSAVSRPAIRPALDEDSKVAARDAVVQARKELGLPQPAAVGAAGVAAAPTAPPAVSATVASAAGSTSSAARTARAADGPAFALSTRALRTRAEADQVMAAARALLAAVRTTGSAALQVEVLPVGEDWRVAAFPYERRADAERAVALLASRGMRVTVVDF